MRPENPLPRINGDLISAAMSQSPGAKDVAIEFMERKCGNYEICFVLVTALLPSALDAVFSSDIRYRLAVVRCRLAYHFS